jgi:peptide deformylase
MTVRPILKLPDPLLRTASKPVAAVDDEVRALFDDMLETMYDAPGIGLAAVQVGVAKRLVVADVVKEENAPRRPLFFANPEIVWASDTLAEYEEGCLSIPEVYDMVTRPDAVRVKFLDRDGRPQEMHCTGLLATCIQHEIDHLNGVLFIDHLSRLKRERITRRFVKAKRQEKEPA